ncbi:MAG: SDR family oxidoreductase [Ignavibacteriales bacterium]|nr:SDR family oxidoreductase [Ignavibacteriales bacterium]
MKNILVTGSNGFIGSNLVIELVRLGFRVKAFHRSDSNIDNLSEINTVHVIGDILDKNSLLNAIRGCDTVFHTAALISFFKLKRQKHFEINVEGTRNVVEACMEVGVEKLIHTSTIGALGYTTDGTLTNENTVYNWGKNIPYRYTKHLAELEVLKGVGSELNATIVNPSIIIGAGDLNIHGGQFVRDIKLGKIPFYADGGVNVVGINDVVAGHIAAARFGKKGERYILGGENLTHKQLFQQIATLINGKVPKIKLPGWLIKSFAVVAQSLSLLPGVELPLTPTIAKNILAYNWCSHEKATSELGYKPQPIEKAILEAYEWYKKNGML